MNLTWFPFSIFATLIFGVAMAFYKLPSAKNHNRFVATFWSLLIPAILSLLFFRSYLPLTTPEMIWTALAWGTSFTFLVLFYFNEPTTALQTLGMIIAAITIFFFLYEGGKLKYSSMLIRRSLF